MTEKKKSAKPKPEADEPKTAKAEKKTAVKAKKPAAAKAPPKMTAEAKPVVRKAAAEKRETQEAGSIAPPTSNLVSAFALFKKPRRAASSSPTIARIAPGGSLSRPPGPPAPEVKPAAPAAPAAQPKPLPAPAPRPGAPSGLPKPLPAPAPRPGAPSGLPKPLPPPAPRPGAPSVPGKQPSAPAPTSQAAPAPPDAPATGAPASPGAPGSRPPARPGGPSYPGRRPPPRFGPPRPGVGRPPAKRRSAPPRSAPKPVEAERPALKTLKVSTMVTVRELAEKMTVRPNEVIAKLMKLGIFATINQRLETEEAAIIAKEFGYEIEILAMYKEEELAVEATLKEAPENLKPRPPVVTVMGHVDHGKTSLLDAIRSANVVQGESGGITQHIGAYRVSTAKGDVVFLDTPGHEAFTAMRARGAKVTDIVILVVSAADGVQPQTVEAIDHAKAAGVPIIVAVNKIDLPGANPQKIRQELSQYGLLSEEWGGKTIFVEVSAKKRVNIDGLLEMLALQAMMMELKANPDRAAHGVILEARLDPKKGNVATVLIQAGTLKVGNSFVAGLAHGKAKALLDSKGRRIMAAGPSIPVEILGVIGAPQAGDVFSVVADERQSREIAERRRIIHREQSLAHQQHVSLASLRSQVMNKARKELNIVLKADVHGSVQAIKDSLEALSNAECRVRAIRAGVGNANESDILLASASSAVVLLFHAEIDSRAAEVAAREGVEVRKYEIIYEVIADVKAALEGLLEPEIVDVVVGRGEVLQVFSVKDGGKVAGSTIREGKVTRGCLARQLRGGSVVHEGKVVSLKRFKDDAKEVEKGLECGISLDKAQGYQPGDMFEFIVKESRTRRLSDVGEKK